MSDSNLKGEDVEIQSDVMENFEERDLRVKIKVAISLLNNLSDILKVCYVNLIWFSCNFFSQVLGLLQSQIAQVQSYPYLYVNHLCQACPVS